MTQYPNQDKTISSPKIPWTSPINSPRRRIKSKSETQKDDRVARKEKHQNKTGVQSFSPVRRSPRKDTQNLPSTKVAKRKMSEDNVNLFSPASVSDNEGIEDDLSSDSELFLVNKLDISKIQSIIKPKSLYSVKVRNYVSSQKHKVLFRESQCFFCHH